MKPKKTKILYLATQSDMGGAQKNVFDLATNLNPDNFEVAVAAGPDGNYELSQQLAEKQIKNFRLKYLRRQINPIYDFLAFFEILFLIIRERPNIIHLHSSKAGFLGALAGRFLGIKKIIYTVHGAVFEAPFSKLTQKFFLYLEKFSAYYKDKIICVSENDKKLWLKYKAAPEEKLVVIHNGINYQGLKFLPQDEARKILFSLSASLFEAAQGSTPDLKIVGTIANFYPEKGLSYLIQTADIIINKNQFKNMVFTVIGEGLERKLLEEMIAEHQLENKFILLGNIPLAWQYLKAFDIFVLPSVKEGLPYTILEAMAAGLPIVASYVGGIPEMIENGINGFLILPCNPEMLVKKILELLANPTLAERFTKNSHGKLKEFSLAKMVKQTQEQYNLLLT